MTAINSSTLDTDNDLQGHLYQSFLHGTAADVDLHVVGSWNAHYLLHRVVLIQAGFFKSLFTGGFLESHAFSSTPTLVQVRFVDINISRSAFELCLSRLYGGGPPLHVPPSLIPTPQNPLTPAFRHSSTTEHAPYGCQLATPCFLLSLLATATYLSIPAIISQALSLIISTIGPYTVMPYLNFALGHSVIYKELLYHQPAVGLNAVALSLSKRMIPPDAYHSSIEPDKDIDSGSKFSEMKTDGNTEFDPTEVPGQSFHYGVLSDRIGHACACWLARWGADMLEIEEIVEQDTSTRPNTESGSFSTNLLDLRIWRRDGLDAKWVKAILSSDLFFVHDEWERYQVMKRAVELRRRAGTIEEEEKMWAELFENGVIYCNLTFDQLLRINGDISPSTGQCFVPQSVLHAANWVSTSLRHHIMTRAAPQGGGSRSPSSPVSRDKELGISVTTSVLASQMSSPSALEPSNEYFLVPNDSVESHFSDEDSSPSSNNHKRDIFCIYGSMATDQDNFTRSSPSETNFFGICNPRHSAMSCVSFDKFGQSRWSPFPPFRFAVEFWDLEALKERSRLHSRTVWYAGSLFNVYVQVVRKKGIQGLQLGIYLHRQSSVDPIPMASTSLFPVISRPHIVQRIRIQAQVQVDETTHSKSDNTQLGAVSMVKDRQVVALRTNSLTSDNVTRTPSPLVASETIPAVVAGPAPEQPYRDPRPQISAFFIISCASSTGSSLTRFSSSPDVFSIGQSWGWKSSSLKSDEYLRVNEGNKSGNHKEMSLRATVILGLV